MRSLLPILTLPLLSLAAPPTAPTITRLVFSGSGCPNDSGSVKSDSSTLGDVAGVSFTQLRGSDTDNCAVHIQSSGATPGWQVAVREISYTGTVNLKAGSELDTYTQVFWSENAGNTATLTSTLACPGPDLNDTITLRASTADLKWSKCTAADGNPGILNINTRPVIQGEAGSYDLRRAAWKLEWRPC
ncbi:hypothetical protein ACN47E_007275 [Coniothyrium glycines]